MKIFWRIAILLGVVLLIFLYSDSRVKENKLLESPVQHGSAVPVLEKGVGSTILQTERPARGLSTLVGATTEELENQFGKPDRIEPSEFGYDWWVYLEDVYFMAGVTDEGLVNQLYTPDQDSDVAPFQIGQKLQDIYRFTIVGMEIDVNTDGGIYTFSLTSSDLKNRLLIIYNELYAQLYIDEVEGILEGIRFIDPTTLVLHQPYEMTYMGDMPVSSYPSSRMQMAVDREAERQIFELTNNLRKKHGLSMLESSEQLTVIAQEQSKSRALENHSISESAEPENLTGRLKEAMIKHRRAGENIAYNYVDAIEAVHGWLNSPAHRNLLLSPYFTHVGTGAYGKYYTQNLIQEHKEDRMQK